MQTEKALFVDGPLAGRRMNVPAGLPELQGEDMLGRYVRFVAFVYEGPPPAHKWQKRHTRPFPKV